MKNKINEILGIVKESKINWSNKSLKLEENFQSELTKSKLINNYSLNLFHQFGLYN